MNIQICNRIIINNGIDFIIKFNNIELGILKWEEIKNDLIEIYDEYEITNNITDILKHEICYRLCNESNKCKLNIEFEKIWKGI